MILSLGRLRETSRVLAYTVHEPPNPPADPIARAERLVFIKDGFSWPALLLGPFWLLINGMWAALLIYLLVAFAIGTVLELLDFAPFWASLTGIALNLILALEADSIRRWTLERRGWRNVGTVVGPSAHECERRFFEKWLSTEPGLHSSAPISARSATAPPTVTGPSATAGFVPPLGQAAAPKEASRLWRLFAGKS